MCEGSPECYRGNAFEDPIVREVGQLTDIWSVGAIYSEFVVWTVLGQPGLASYRDSRSRATAYPEHKDPGCFHDKIDRLPCVDEAHSQAVQEARGSDTITELIVAEILPRMLCNRSDRLDARQLLYSFENILTRAKARQKGTSISRSQSTTIARQEEFYQVQRFERPLKPSPRLSTIMKHRDITDVTKESETVLPVAGSSKLQSSLTAIRTTDEQSDTEDNRIGTQRRIKNYVDTAPPRRSLVHCFNGHTTSTPVIESLPTIKLTLAAVEEKMRQDKQHTIWGFGRRNFKSLLADIDTDHTIRNLGNRDHVFLVDDSQSMNPHWPLVTSLLEALA